MNRLTNAVTNMFRIPELRRRILITLALLGVFRFGSAIPVPGIDMAAVEAFMENMADTAGGRTFGFLMLFSGGAAKRLSIFSLGIMPYITSAIIFQMLTKVVPSLEQLSKEGPSGQRKIKQYTRLCTVPICVFQGFMLSVFLFSRVELVVEGFPWWLFYLGTTIILAGGAIFIMWLGEQITEHGVGNGASIIIMAGILAAMPKVGLTLWENVRNGIHSPDKVLVLGVLYILAVAGITFVNMSQRRIPVQHGKHVRGRRMYGGQKNYLPLKVNQAGVMPLIFASSLLMFPMLLGRSLEGAIPWLSSLLVTIGGGTGQSLGFLYVLFYASMVFFFSYFWTALMFQPVDMADQLKERGSFVPGVRPGKNTANFLERIMNRITLAGATFLALLALIPDIVAFAFGFGQMVTRFLGGTGLLIIVSVAMDTVERIESQMMMREYEGFFKEAGKSGRSRSPQRR